MAIKIHDCDTANGQSVNLHFLGKEIIENSTGEFQSRKLSIFTHQQAEKIFMVERNSNHTLIGKAVIPVIAYNDVVKHFDVKSFTGFHHFFGEVNISLARRKIS